MKFRKFAYSLVTVAALVASVVVAQTPGATSTATGTDTAATSTASDVQKSLEEILEEPTTTDTYRYDPQGRRDPFRSLIGPTPQLEPGQRPPGVPGFLIDELKLQGIFQTRQGLTAMVNGPDNTRYTVRAGQKVLDGEIIRITSNSIVFRQEVNDPTRIERYREVVKELVPATTPNRR
jgi:type IV pilus assembly protein PilP